MIVYGCSGLCHDEMGVILAPHSRDSEPILKQVQHKVQNDHIEGEIYEGHLPSKIL